MTFSGLTKIISFEPFYKVTKAYQVLSARSVQARIQDFEMGGWGVLKKNYNSGFYAGFR